MNTRGTILLLDGPTVAVVEHHFVYCHSDFQGLAASGAVQRISEQRLATVATVPLTGNGCGVNKWLSPTVLQMSRLFAAKLEGCGGLWSGRDE